MKVSDWMSAELITVSPKTGLSETWELMRRRRIRHLLVTERGRLLGIISDRDIRLALAAHGELDRDHPDEEVQQPRHSEPGPSHNFERLGIGDVFGDVCGVLHFFFDDRFLSATTAVRSGTLAAAATPLSVIVPREAVLEQTPCETVLPIGGGS